MSRRSWRESGRSTRAALIEALEERRLLYDYVFNATDNGESLVAQMQGGNLVVGIIGGPGITIPSPSGKTVLLNALGGNDTIFLNTNGGAIITVDAGAGDDTIQLGGGSSQNLSNLPGNTSLTGGSGFDTVLAQDGNNPSASTYTITDARFDRPGWGGFYYEADIESLTLYPTQLNDTVNVLSTWPNQPVHISNRGGNDNVFFGNPTQGVQGIRAHLYTEGTGTNTLWISDVGNRSNVSANIDWHESPAWGKINNFAPARIHWQAANTAQVNVIAGGGVNSLLIYSTCSPMVINKGDSNLVGNDSVQIGSPLVGGLVAILAPVQVQNDLQFTNVVITNEGDPANRTWTIDSANGFGSLVGMAPAAISWKNNDVGSISLQCGNGSDTGTIRRFSRTLSINNSSGTQNLDTIQIGHPDVGGAQQITGGGITIDNDPWYTDLVVENTADLLPRNITLDFVNGYDVLSGLAPATIRYDDADVEDVVIGAGRGANSIDVRRTFTSGAGGGSTTVYGNASSIVNVGNPIDGLQSIGTEIRVWGSSPFSTSFSPEVILDNRADTIGRSVNIVADSFVAQDYVQITGLIPGRLIYANSPLVQLLGGRGTDSYVIASTSMPDLNFLSLLKLDTGAGDDVVNAGGTTFDRADVELIEPVIGLASLTVQNNGRVFLGGPANQVLSTGSISLTGTAVLDVRDKAVIVNYSGASPIESIRAGISSGYNAGAWNGSGIHSSTAATTAGTAVGFAEATDLFSTFPASFAGQSIDNTSILLRHTLNGDANLDHTTNLLDFNRLASNFGQPLRRWSTGDFNFDTGANLADFNIMAGQFGQALGPDGGMSGPVRQLLELIDDNLA